MVDLTVYTDNSPYTAPCDGLMKVSISPVTNAYAYGYINRVRVSSVSNITTASMAGYSCVTIPIRKGMKLYGHTSSISDGYEVVQFIPYK